MQTIKAALLLCFLLVVCVFAGTAEEETELELMHILETNHVVMFTRDTCPRSVMARQILENLSCPYANIVVDMDDNGPAMHKAVYRVHKVRDIPLIFINGEKVGGFEELKELRENGQLVDILENLGIELYDKSVPQMPRELAAELRRLQREKGEKHLKKDDSINGQEEGLSVEL